LGLAIVKKIMEDHLGELLLEDTEGGGARVTLVFSTELRGAVRAAPGGSQPVGSDVNTVAHGA
jgi:two-component system nitrogen regulation sensor histidine kinase NtrY